MSGPGDRPADEHREDPEDPSRRSGLSSGDPLWSGEDPARRIAPPPAPEPPAVPAGWLPPTDAPPHADDLRAPEPVAPAPPPPEDRGWAPPAGAGAAPWPGTPAAAPQRATLTPAGYSARVGAAFVDFFVRLAIVLACYVVGAIGYAGGSDVGAATVNAAGLVGLVLGLAYAPLMMGRTNGQTVGHRATGTRIVRRDGLAMTPGWGGVREVLVKGLLFEVAAVLFVFIPTLLNYLWPLWDENNEALHDKICGTRVVEV